MKCQAFEVVNLRGKWPVVEIGAPYVGNGDLILLKPGIWADRFGKSHSKFLEDKGIVERPKLRNGTYDVEKAGAKKVTQSAVKTPSEAPAKNIGDKSMSNKKNKKTKASKKKV